MENIFANLGDADLDKVIASYAVDDVDMEFNIRKFRQRIYDLAVDEKRKRERSVRHGKTFMECVIEYWSDTREVLISFLEELSKLGGDTNFDKWTTSVCAKWIDWVKNQDPTWFEEELEKSYKNGYEDAKREILGLVDIESMAKAYEQRLINTMSNHPSITLSVASFIHGANCVLDELYLKQCQVKESDISQHETKTCEEINDSLTSEDDRIRREIEQFLKQHNGWNKEWLAWLEKQDKQDKQHLYNIIGEKLNVLKYIRQETCCGLAEANDALMKLIKVLKEHPMCICDRPHTLKIEWEEKQ